VAESIIYRRKKDLGANPLSESLFDPQPWFSTLFDDYRELSASELPEGVASGAEFTSVQFNVMIYLHWLLGQCLARGVVVKRAVVEHISEVAHLSHTGEKADIVINASGLLACRLGGVMDTTVVPARGQIVLVRNEATPMICSSGTDDGDEELFYVMMRAAGGGTILGGTYAKGNWDGVPDPNIANRIMARAIKAHPALLGGKEGGVEKLDVIRHGVGLRPFRKDGVRIEREKLADGVWVVHNYGHAGWGYQGSYGCAEHVVELVSECVAEKGVNGLKV
jgi:D-amino-acid oxidase